MFNNKDIRTTSLDIILISLFLTLNTYFTIFSSVLMVDFEQVKVCYVMVYSGLFLILEFSCKGWFEKCISVGYPDPGRREKNELRFLFLRFFVLLGKVLWRSYSLIQFSKMHGVGRIKIRKNLLKNVFNSFMHNVTKWLNML